MSRPRLVHLTTTDISLELLLGPQLSAFVDAGYEVIYTGLFQTPQTVASAAVDEDVDAIGLSMLSGAHMTLAPLVVDEVRKLGSDIPVVVGGIVPKHDVDALMEAGVAAVITPGANADQVVETIRNVLAT